MVVRENILSPRCHYDFSLKEQYIGKTNQNLDVRIKQHMPTKIYAGNWLADKINNAYGSAITEHLVNNCNCAFSNSDDLFTVLSKSHLDFHWKVLETVHNILTYNPSLCKERDCLLALNLITISIYPPRFFTHNKSTFPFLS